MIKLTIPKPGTKKEVEEEDAENEEENVDTELKVNGGEEGDVANSKDVGEEERAPDETDDANAVDTNGTSTNEGNGDEGGLEEEEEEDGGEEQKEQDGVGKLKPGAKSTTVIIARTHPGESNTSFIVQGQWERRT